MSRIKVISYSIILLLTLIIVDGLFPEYNYYKGSLLSKTYINNTGRFGGDSGPHHAIPKLKHDPKGYIFSVLTEKSDTIHIKSNSKFYYVVQKGDDITFVKSYGRITNFLWKINIVKVDKNHGNRIKFNKPNQKNSGYYNYYK